MLVTATNLDYTRESGVDGTCSPLGATLLVPSTPIFMIKDWFHVNIAILICLDLYSGLESPQNCIQDSREKHAKSRNSAEEFIKAALCRQNKYIITALCTNGFFSVSVYSDHSAVCNVNEIESLKRI